MRDGMRDSKVFRSKGELGTPRTHNGTSAHAWAVMCCNVRVWMVV